MIRYHICNLESWRDFSVDNIAFKRTDEYSKRIQILRDEKRDQLTFCATLSDRTAVRRSMLFSGKRVTSVNDMMILLSLVQSRDVYFPKAEDIGGDEVETWGMRGGNRKAWGSWIIMEHELESFLTTSLRQMRESAWLRKTGLTPAVFWLLESILTNSLLEIRFVSAWIALEVLANFHASSHGLKNYGVRTRIEKLVNHYTWDFMDISLIRDWTVIRDKYMHRGSASSLRNMSGNKIATRYFQLVWSMQIALVDLLGFGDFARRQYIISEIGKSERERITDNGPFPLPP